MFAVKFVGHVGTYGGPGMFPTRENAQAWAKLECDGRAFIITRLDHLPHP